MGRGPASTRCPCWPKGGELTGPNPTDRAESGTKYRLLVTANGLPLAVTITRANRHGALLVESILNGLVPARGRGRGRPRPRPEKWHADKACAFRRVRRCLVRREITARIARLGVDSSERLGRHRWVVERTISWLLAFRRLATRYDRSAVTIICARRLPTRPC